VDLSSPPPSPTSLDRTRTPAIVYTGRPYTGRRCRAGSSAPSARRPSRTRAPGGRRPSSPRPSATFAILPASQEISGEAVAAATDHSAWRAGPSRSARGSSRRSAARSRESSSRCPPRGGEGVGHGTGVLDPGVARMEENEPRLEEPGLAHMGTRRYGSVFEMGPFHSPPCGGVKYGAGSSDPGTGASWPSQTGHVKLPEGRGLPALAAGKIRSASSASTGRRVEADEFARDGTWIAHEAVLPDGAVHAILEGLQQLS